MHVFLGMSTRMYIYIYEYLYLYCVSKKIIIMNSEDSKLGDPIPSHLADDARRTLENSRMGCANSDVQNRSSLDIDNYAHAGVESTSTAVRPGASRCTLHQLLFLPRNGEGR
jgi:hypothetical protein